MSDRGKGMNLAAHRRTLLNTETWFCSYGAPISLSFPEGDFFRVQFHHNGRGSTKIGHKEYAVTPNQSVISSAPAQIHFGDGFEQTVLKISKAGLTRKLSALTGNPIVRPITFETTFDPTSPQSEILKANFDYFLRILNTYEEKTPPLVLLELEQVLVTSFLSCCPNSYSRILENQSVGVAPWQVSRVEDYIEANWNKPLTIEDIAAITECSARSLFRAFQQSRGCSPMNYIKQVRLRHAQKLLLSDECKVVTEAAHACGFADHGRFSRDYRRAFGELPSQTLKRKTNRT